MSFFVLLMNKKEVCIGVMHASFCLVLLFYIVNS